ncbi:exosome complex component RRP45-like [Argiope bruennichi]|uniref:exosome complex component RRP45-like n=1 Tax=Argiope bruennichi TaxID=94029 RepID=UPI002494E1D3|nr:exosome complex component RRP45-like [Argiope bruennichi]
MKITSITEREFITSIILKNKRLDGRHLVDGRTLNIKFLKEWGGCIVYLGNTVVLSQVTAEVTEPKASSPTEGALQVNFEVSPMSAPDVNLSRSSNEFVELQRSLERCIRDSKCIDLESLCIVAGIKVWTIKVDIRAMNDDGNLLECGSIAAISALSHFKRPDVTVVGTEVTVHSLDDREPVSLNLHHMPIGINMALFCQGTYIVLDPTEAEERISDGCYIIGMNAHQEVCFIHRKGSLLLPEETIKKCIELAIRRAQTVTQTIRAALDDDEYKRLTKAPVGIVNMLQTGTILGARQPIYNFDLNSFKTPQTEVEMVDAEVITVEDGTPDRPIPVISASTLAVKEHALRILKEGEATVFEGGASKWGMESEEEETSSDEKEEPSVPAVKQETYLSSEEETGYLESDHIDVKPSSTRGWYSKNPFS